LSDAKHVHLIAIPEAESVDGAGDGHLDVSGAGTIVVIKGHYLLPSSKLKAPVCEGKYNRRSHKSSLDMTVPVSVMPSLLVRVFDTRRGQSIDSLF